MPTLTKAQLNRLTRLVGKINKASELLAGAEQSATEKGFESLLPPYLIPKCGKSKAFATSTVASLEMAIDAKKGNFDELFKDADDCFKKTTSIADSLSNALEEAKAHAEEQEDASKVQPDAAP